MIHWKVGFWKYDISDEEGDKSLPIYKSEREREREREKCRVNEGLFVLTAKEECK